MKSFWKWLHDGTNIALSIHFIASAVLLAILGLQLHDMDMLREQVQKDRIVIGILVMAEAHDQQQLRVLVGHCTQPSVFWR